MVAADTVKEINIEVKRCPDCGARFGIDAAFCPFDGASLVTSTWDKAGDPRAHLRVGDRYEVLEPLGEGGMGTVYKVRHITLDRSFAMKVLRRDLATDANLAKRFLQEARTTAAIKHPAVVAITDFGEMEDGIPYFVMELLEGETLATRIRARGPLPPRTATRIAKQIAEGLGASHAAGVIHRDLKPDNIFLVGERVGKGPEDEIRIVDFGAAKVIGGSKLTRPGIVFGTPYYMSPEQASGQTIDARADVYSLGILLYEMVTGRVPFEADTYMGVLTKHMFQAPARPVVPAGIELGDLEAVVMRALQKDPSHRYGSMAEVIRALEQADAARPAGPSPHGLAPKATLKLPSMSTADRIELSVNQRVAAEARRKRGIVAFGVFAACSAFGFGGALAVFSPKMQTPSSHSATPSSSPNVTRGPSSAEHEPALDEPASALDRAALSAPHAPLSTPARVSTSSTVATTVATAVSMPTSVGIGSTMRRSSPPTTASSAPPRSRATAAPSESSPNVSSGKDEFKDPWK